MYYSVLTDGCESFEELRNFSGAVKLVLNFGKPSEVEQKYLNFVISSKSRLKFSENLGIELSSQPQPNSTGILDSSFASLPVTLVQSQLQANQVLLPSCVVCLSRLDRNVTGLCPLTCRDLYHFCCQQQCRLLSSGCAVCFSISNEQKVSCADCGSVDDLWICLLCGNVGCGRYRGGHAHDHFEAERHVFALNSESHHIWDYQDDRYVHRTIRCAQGIVAIEEIEPGHDAGEESSFSAELSTAQLESQKAFFDERLRLQEAHFTRLIAAKEVEYAEELQKVKTELEHLQRERLVFSELKSQLQARIQQQKTETERFSKDFEAEKLISAGLVKRNDELQLRVEAICAERDELNEQIVDLMKHFETLELVAQAGNSSEIVNGKIVIKPSAASKKSASKKKT